MVVLDLQESSADLGRSQFRTVHTVYKVVLLYLFRIALWPLAGIVAWIYACQDSLQRDRPVPEMLFSHDRSLFQVSVDSEHRKPVLLYYGHE